MKQKILILFSVLLLFSNYIRSQALPIGVQLPDNIVESSCYTSPPAFDWGIESVWASATIVSNMIIPLVGDLNDDGIPEIVCFGAAGRINLAGGTAVSSILVFDGKAHNQVATISLPSPVTEYDAAPYGLVKTPERQGLIIVASYDNRLRAYDITSATSNTPIWTSEVFGSGGFATNVGFADFNNDGYPEVYVYNKIYDASTGILLATATGGTNSGSSWSHFSHTTGRKISSPIAVDMDGDGKLELILGNEIYKVTITNRNGTSGNSITLSKTKTPPAGVVADGHAQAVDFNKDGHLDVLITNRDIAPAAGGKVAMYVWDVHNDKISTPVIIPTHMSGKSIPLIADVDNDGELEIILQCAVNGNTEKVGCYKYDPIAMTFSYLWGFAPDEDSWSNGATLFDFNQDGKNEVLISDQSRISIVNGSGKSHLTGNDTVPMYIMTTMNFGQMTVMQYPLIVDVDGDGSAEIVAVGVQNSANSATGRLNIFKSSTTPWAPARKVWNQYMYNAVNVNNDLTIPTVQLNPASTFAGDDRSLGTGDDVRPFNNYLQQQTILSQDGIPLGLTPNGEIIGSPTFVYDDIADEMIIILQMRNGGGAIFQNPFYSNSI